MRNLVFAVLGCMICSTCPAATPEPGTSGVAVIYGAGSQADCRDYAATALIDGRQQPVVGRICQQPDGSWHITDATPRPPTPDEILEPRSIDSPYAPPLWSSYDPWLWGPPIGFGLGAVIVGGGHRNSPRFDSVHVFIPEHLHERAIRERRRERVELGNPHERLRFGDIRAHVGHEHIGMERPRAHVEAGDIRERHIMSVPRGRPGTGAMRGGFGRHG